jgi:subtilase family serine protease
VLVEAQSASNADLASAVDAAAAAGATVISNSYSGAEYANEDVGSSYCAHPGIAITAAAGDKGYSTGYPAASACVVAVGGTSLSRATNARGWSETVWSGTGSGCSSDVSKPSWQHDTACAKRTMNDVAAVADPNTGVAVYTYYRKNSSAWLVYGGTSVATPVIAGVYALAGNAHQFASSAAQSLYLNPAFLNDVTVGSDGSCGNSLCTAGAGYDGPTGLGTPNGLGAF